MRFKCPCCRRIVHSSALDRGSAPRRKDRICRQCAKAIITHKTTRVRKTGELLPRLICHGKHGQIPTYEFDIYKIGADSYIRRTSAQEKEE